MSTRNNGFQVKLPKIRFESGKKSFYELFIGAPKWTSILNFETFFQGPSELFFALLRESIFTCGARTKSDLGGAERNIFAPW